MKKILFRKILIDFLHFLMLTLISTSIILWIFQAVNYLDLVIEDGRNYGVYFTYTLLSLPKIISKILPFSIFFSFYFILNKYENNNEMIIFWSFGINKIFLINFFLKFSILLMLFQIFLTTLLIPKTQDIARSLIRTSNLNFFEEIIKEKKFNDTVKDLTIHIDEKDAEGNLKNIYLKRDLGENNFEVTYAKRGNFKIINNIQLLILYEGKNITSNNNNITNFNFSETTINLSKIESNIMKVTKTQENTTIDLFKCYYLLKKNKVNKIEKNKFFRIENCTLQNLKVILRELYKRIFIPIYIPSLVIISLLLFLTSKQNINFTKHKIYIFMMGLLLIIISETSLRYVGSDINENIFLILFPFFSIFLLYIFLFINLKNKIN